MKLLVWSIAAIGLCGLTLGIIQIKSASADHNVYLPLIPNTPLMRQVIETQGHVWCADSRASNYPNFLTQLRDVNNEYAERVGIRHREVAFTDPACMVKHVMPDGLSCTGWAAQIFYANNPVTVQYCYTLGYQDWRTAQGHELGHGLLGLHEQYKDSGGNISCTGRTWTVMDCSSGVRYPQQWDVDNGCAALKTAWCGQAPVVCEPYGGCFERGIWVWKIPGPALWTWDPARNVGPGFDQYGGWWCHSGCAARPQ